jgi:hypothetical protein
MANYPDRYVHEYWDPDVESVVVDDVTASVKDAFSEVERLTKDNESLDKQLTDIRTRRGWDELSIATDERTGRVIAVRTFYQWEAKTLRLEVSPEMLGGRY